MTKGTDHSSGCAYLGFLSLIASLAGAALAAPVYTAMHYSQFAVGNGMEAVGNLLLATGLVFYFGAGMAVPVGLLLGIPLLASSRRYLHHTVLAALIFAILGLLGGLAIKHFGGSTGLDNAQLVFGACVGGMHPLVYGRANGVTWSKIGAATLASAMIVPSVTYAGEDVHNATGSRHEFEARCADIYGSMAVVRERADLERWGIPPPYGGRWLNQREWRSLYQRVDMVLLDKTRVLVARDFAYVPSGFTGWVKGGRRVEKHCLTEKKGAEAELLRRRGFGMRPSLRDLAD